MGNLNQPIKRLLFNTMDASEVGITLSTKESQAQMWLTFKKSGYRIPGKTPAYATTIDNSPSGTLSTNIVRNVKEKPEPGYLSGTMITLSNAAPAYLQNYAYGFDVIKELWLPGVDNAQPEWRFRTYSGSLPIVTLSSGVIQDADLLTMENDLLDQITGDVKTDASAIYFNDTDRESIVEARRAYYINDTAANHTSDNSGFTVTWDDGSTYAFAISTTWTAGQLAIQFNANSSVNTKLIMYRTGANTYIVTSRNAGLKFTLGTFVANAALNTTQSRRIYLKGRNVNVKHKVRITPDRGVAEKVTFITLMSTTTAGTTTFKVNGVATAAVTDNATFATYSGNINSALSTASITSMYATYDSTNIYLWGSSAVNTFYVAPSALSTTVLNGLGVVGRGSFPKLRDFDVFQTFAYTKDQGPLGAQEYNTQVIKGATYYKYIVHAFINNMTASGLPSGYDSMKQRTEIYVLSTVATTNIYTAASNLTWAFTNSGTPNKSFEDLLGIVTGLAVSSW